MEPLKVIPLGQEDMSAVATLEACCFSTPWQEEQLLAALKQPHFTVYGLKRQARLVAYISLSRVADEVEVLNIATLPEERRQGHARLLLRHVLEWAAVPGGRAFLEVRAGNLPALALYRSLGFKQVGIRRTYYRDTGENGLIMSLELPLKSPSAADGQPG